MNCSHRNSNTTEISKLLENSDYDIQKNLYLCLPLLNKQRLLSNLALVPKMDRLAQGYLYLASPPPPNHTHTHRSIFLLSLWCLLNTGYSVVSVPSLCELLLKWYTGVSKKRHFWHCWNSFTYHGNFIKFCVIVRILYLIVLMMFYCKMALMSGSDAILTSNCI